MRRRKMKKDKTKGWILARLSIVYVSNETRPTNACKCKNLQEC